MTQNISLIPPLVFDVVEDDFARLIKPALDMSHGREDLANVTDRIRTGAYQLWLVFDEDNKAISALVTRLEEYPIKRMLNFMFIGGAEMSEWHEDLLSVLEIFAREQGCSGFELTGRPGWKKFLQKQGWDTPYVVCERMFALEEEQRDVA